MSTTSVGFIGGGRVASILLGGWTRSGTLPRRVVVSDTREETLEALGRHYGTIETLLANNTAAAEQDVVFLAVHPPVIPEVTGEVAAHLGAESILVSLAPKFTIDKLSEALGGFRRVARTIPNAPSVVGQGYNPVAFSNELTEDDRRRVIGLLTPLGECPHVPESHLEAYAIVTAMGPTYFWPQLLELRSLAKHFGLTTEEANEGLMKMLLGAQATVNDSGLSSEEIMDLVSVKPLADEVAAVAKAYPRILTAVMEKIHP